MAAYSVLLQRTASTTLPVGNIIADATRPRRGRVYELVFGSEATPADNPFLWQIQRCTTAGTGTSITPVAVNPADAATEADAAYNHTIAPTLTANAFVLSVALNQRATFRWVANPGEELIYPATASNGLAVITPTSSALAVTCQLYFREE